MPLADNFSRTVQKTGRLVGRGDRSLGVGLWTAGAHVNITLCPNIDRCGAARKKGCASGIADCNWNVQKLDIAKDNRACQGSRAGLSGSDEGGGVGDSGIDDSFSLTTLISLGCTSDIKFKPNLNFGKVNIL